MFNTLFIIPAPSLLGRAKSNKVNDLPSAPNNSVAEAKRSVVAKDLFGADGKFHNLTNFAHTKKGAP